MQAYVYIYTIFDPEMSHSSDLAALTTMRFSSPIRGTRWCSELDEDRPFRRRSCFFRLEQPEMSRKAWRIPNDR